MPLQYQHPRFFLFLNYNHLSTNKTNSNYSNCELELLTKLSVNLKGLGTRGQYSLEVLLAGADVGLVAAVQRHVEQFAQVARGARRQAEARVPDGRQVPVPHDARVWCGQSESRQKHMTSATGGG